MGDPELDEARRATDVRVPARLAEIMGDAAAQASAGCERVD
jgi:hypothetical protein